MRTLLRGEDTMHARRPRGRWANGASGTTAAGGWATPAHRRSRPVVPPSESLRSRVAGARAVGSGDARLAWPPPCCAIRVERDGRSGIGPAPSSVWLKIGPGEDRLNGQRGAFRDIAGVVCGRRAYKPIAFGK